MVATTMPPREEMMDAFLRRDPRYDGVFVVAVRSTAIFCRPSCPARKPRRDNTLFYPSAREALLAGFRPCLRCRPLEPPGAVPSWLEGLLRRVEDDPAHRWREADLRRMGLDPGRVRRWFRKHHGMTFHAYARSRRLAGAFEQVRAGTGVTRAAMDHGYDSMSGFGEAFRNLFGVPPSRADSNVAPVTIDRILTPLGPMIAGATRGRLCLLEFTDRRGLESQMRRLAERLGAVLVPGTDPVLERASREIAAYFEGRLRRFRVPLALPGTAFQMEVWERLRQVPYGSTASYAEIASELGRPAGARAVARANGDNRIAIIVPCHRVVGADGRLTGYGGGLWRKRRLLDHERANRDAASPRPLE